MIDHEAPSEMVLLDDGMAFSSVVVAAEEAQYLDSIWKDIDRNMFYARPDKPDGANWVLVRPPRRP